MAADRRMRVAVVVAVVLAAIALVVAMVAVAGNDDDDETAAPGTTETTTTTSSTSSSTTTSTTAPPSTAVWPPADIAPITDAKAAATGFATTYLGFAAPVVGELQQGDSRSGEVEVRPRPDGPVTTILLRMLGTDGAWSVLGAATADIELTSPAALDEVASPVRLEGRALAFEGNVAVEVREDGAAMPLGSGFVTGGGDVMRAFTGEVTLERQPSAPAGAIVLFTRSAADGTVWSASVVRIRFADRPPATSCTPTPTATAGADEMVVTVTFSCDEPAGAPLVEVRRVVPRSTGVLRATVEALLAGPTEEERASGIGSWFSDATRGALRSVDLDDGHAVVDFSNLDRLIPNASASAGSERLLAELDATVLGVEGVTSVEYRLDGSCEDFGLWLQMDGCLVRGGGEEGR